MSESEAEIISTENPLSEESEVAGTETEQQDDTPKTPPKFEGKSMDEIVEMYSNLEKEHSRQGNELGENRKLVDHFLKTEQFKPTETHVQAEPELDWDYEPEKAATSLVQKEVGELRDELQELKQGTALERFKGKYPNFDKDSASSEFAEWVQGSEYRTNLYNKNYNGIDLVAASELMDGWKDYKSYQTNSETQTQEQAEAKRKSDLKAGTMEKGAGAGGSRKKMWSRAYIRHLRMNEPAKYSANYDEIQAAYAEDRVTK